MPDFETCLCAGNGGFCNNMAALAWASYHFKSGGGNCAENVAYSTVFSSTESSSCSSGIDSCW